MTDEQMDARLRAAGERWRAGTAVAEPGLDDTAAPIDLLVQARQRRSQRWLAIASAAVLVVALAVGGTLVARNHGESEQRSGLAAASLTGRTWWLPTAAGSLRIVGGTIHITNGCPGQVNHVTVDAHTFAVGGLIRPASTPAQSVQLTRFARMLTGTVSWSIDGTTLTLRKSGLRDLQLTSNPRLAQELIGHAWLLDGTETSFSSRNSGSGSGSSAVALSSILFSADGTFAVAHRCYTDSGKVAITPTTLALTDVTLRRALPCPSNAVSPDGQKQNDFVDNLLEGTVHWHLAGKQLTITKGHDTATFRQRPR
jgi:heat shock protein HslJ